MKPSEPHNEKKRLETLKSYHILDSIPEQEYDDLTFIASQICGVPISLISLIDEDRQWFKSKHGLTAQQTEREHAFCAHAINYPDEVFTVNDSRKDARFQDNPLVKGDPHVVFYTGIPIVTQDGMALGTLCVIDNKPRELTSEQVKALKALSNQVLQLLELRRNKKLLEEQNLFLQQFASVAAHDIKAPLNNLAMISEILMKQESMNLSEEGKNWIKLINTSASNLQSLIHGILSYSKNINHIKEDFTTFTAEQCFKEVKQLLEFPDGTRFEFTNDSIEIHGNYTLWCQTILNLIQNGIKYNNKPDIVIQCQISIENNNYQIVVKDNGDGIPSNQLNVIFEPFKVLVSKDRFGKKGHGLGLSMIKKWIEQMDGTIEVQSEVNVGTTFTITFPIQEN